MTGLGHGGPVVAATLVAVTGTDVVPVADRGTPLLLAVYGTLRRGCRNARLLAGAEAVADGTVAGTLHEVAAPLGDRPYSYPLLVLADPGTSPGDSSGDRADGSGGLVRVEVYRVVEPRMLDALDELEAYDPDDPAGSEYVRVVVPLRDAGPDAPPEVQVYVHAGTADGRGPVLLGGDWSVHAGELA